MSKNHRIVFIINIYYNQKYFLFNFIDNYKRQNLMMVNTKPVLRMATIFTIFTAYTSLCAVIVYFFF